MTFILLAIALAQEPPATVYVPEGKSIKTEGPSYVIAEERMDALLAKAKSVPELLEKIQACADESVVALDEANEALVLVKQERQEDHDKMIGLTSKIVVLEEKNTRLKGQRNTAVALSIGLATGVVAAVEISRRLP